MNKPTEELGIAQLLKFPEGIRGRITRLCLEEHGSEYLDYILDYPFDGPREFLLVAFTWCDTEEGAIYWDELYEA